MALECAAARPRRCLPQLYGLVVRCRRDQLAVRREGYGVDFLGLALERAAARPRRCLPQPYGLVVGCRRD